MTGTMAVIVAGLSSLVNAVAILTIAWRGGRMVGRLETVVSTLEQEVGSLRSSRHDHIEAIAALKPTVELLSGDVARLSERVDRLTAQERR